MFKCQGLSRFRILCITVCNVATVGHVIKHSRRGVSLLQSAVLPADRSTARRPAVIAYCKLSDCRFAAG